MNSHNDIRDKIIRSLSAVGAVKDARFYAELFSDQDPDKFALVVIDPRCLKNPLLESLIGNLRILSDLGLTPTLLVGALDEDMTRIRFSAQRLAKDLESAKVKTARLNTETYGLFDSLRKAAQNGRITILESTSTQKQQDLVRVISNLQPAKVIFLQPSGGITADGRRVAVINIDANPIHKLDNLSEGQKRFIQTAQTLLRADKSKSVYVIASPLNLLPELFTVKGSGTLIRKGARFKTHKSIKKAGMRALKKSIESGFDKKITSDIREWPVKSLFLEEKFRAGAIITELSRLTYLSKFWVIKEAQGEGIARDLWDQIESDFDSFFWRSRQENPFNEWYLKQCEGMQLVDDWRVFWRGLSPEEVSVAIEAAIRAPQDFSH
ncbi:MAG: hypothetical protein HKN36_12400 [Hellea sp.]|nr:hypothetical protein [Hellea sp.]